MLQYMMENKSVIAFHIEKMILKNFGKSFSNNKIIVINGRNENIREKK